MTAEDAASGTLIIARRLTDIGLGVVVVAVDGGDDDDGGQFVIAKPAGWANE